ncbi:hypothetical protein BDQ17DRAFT_250898 [Cyathus striatus]|nr:hypothetical protein BDQ17DRAFT_250898 [Cyathus striatus]
MQGDAKHESLNAPDDQGSMPPLPPELIDLIISHLHEDSYSLKSCSLVCRAWVPRSRYYLFVNPVQLQLGVAEHCERFVELFGKGTGLSKYVRFLTLVGAPQRKSYRVLQCLNTFSWVEELRLVKFMNLYNWATPDLAQRAKWLIPFRSIRRLHISSSSVSFFDFLTLLRHTPLLSALTFEIVSWTSSWQKVLATQKSSSECFVPLLRKLKFGIRSSAVIPAFNALFSRNYIPRVSNLVICGISRVHAQDVGDLLCTLGPSLQSLKVSSDNLLRDLFASEVWNLFVSNFSDWALELLVQLPERCNKMKKITLAFILAQKTDLKASGGRPF